MNDANPNMPDANKCPQCGTPLKNPALGGLCPACLLAQGASDTVTDPKQPSFNPPSVAELTTLFPQLEVLELIGKGGMGAVYKARQKQLDRIVALKILPPGIGEDPAFAERFTREAKALAKLNHPNIVTLYEFGRADGLFFFLMEFVDGVNLRQLLSGERISPREALAIVPQICDALQFAHDHRIVHRDIKPENILMDRRGRVKVADFGVAKLVGPELGSVGRSVSENESGQKSSEVQSKDEAAAGHKPALPDLTDAGKIMGTPRYMAPEQMERPSEVDHRVDIYALGVVFYQMLTGELPGKSIEPPSKKVQIDVRLDEIVLRALEKNPERRYEHASVLKTQVETIATNPSDLVDDRSENRSDDSGASDSNVRKMLNVPSLAIIVISSLSLLAVAVAIPVWVYGAFLGFAGKALVLPYAFVILMMLLMVVMGGFNVVSLIGAWRMRQLRSHALAVVGSILFMLTPGLGFSAAIACKSSPSVVSAFFGGLLAFVFGIWSLIALSRKETREAFAKRRRLRGKVGSHAGKIQIACFAAALVLFVLGLWKLTQFELKPHELFFGVLLVCILTFSAVALGLLAVSVSASSQPTDRAEAPTASGTLAGEIIWANVAAVVFWCGLLLTLVFWRANFSHAAVVAVLAGSTSMAWILSLVSWRVAAKNPNGRWQLLPPAPAGCSPGEKFRRRFVNSWIRKIKAMVWELPIVALMMIGIFTFVLAPFDVKSDAVSPEVPRGSRVLVWKLTRSFEPGDVILYKQQGTNMLGRVIGRNNSPEHELVVERRGANRDDIRPSAVIGKVIFNTRSSILSATETQVVTSSVQFGPVIEQVVTDAIDFDSGKLIDLPLPHPLGDRDPARYEWFNSKESSEWKRQHGIDAVNGNHALIGANLQLMKLDENEWNTLAADQLSRRLLASDATDTFESTHKTFGFKTREGGMGILLIMEDRFIPGTATTREPGVKIRYKLVQTSKENAPAHLAKPKRIFGPAVERTVEEAIDFDSGKLGKLPETEGSDSIAENVLNAFAWMDREGMDGVAETTRSFLGVGMKLKVVDRSAWDRFTADELEKILKEVRPATSRSLAKTNLYAFETREGMQGLFEILDFTDQGVKLRYKLVNKSSAVPADEVGNKVAFAPVIERSLPDPDADPSRKETLQFRSGEMFEALEGAPKEQGGRLRALVASEGDLFAEYDDYVSKRWALITANLRLADFPARQWESATAQEIVEALKEPTVISHVQHFGATLYLLPEDFLPLTLAFETREGARGLLQITKFEDNPRSLKIRYKLLAKTSEVNATLKPIPPRAAELMKEIQALYQTRNASNSPVNEKEFRIQLSRLEKELESVLAGTAAEPLLKQQQEEMLKMQEATRGKDKAKIKETTDRIQSIGSKLVELINPDLLRFGGNSARPKTTNESTAKMKEKNTSAVESPKRSDSTVSKQENEFSFSHREKLGQAVLDASRDFVEEHQWKLIGESGGTTNGVLSVTIEASDLNGKRVIFEDAQQADGMSRFTVKVEPGSEFSANRIGTAIARRLGLAAGWTGEAANKNSETWKTANGRIEFKRLARRIGAGPNACGVATGRRLPIAQAELEQRHQH